MRQDRLAARAGVSAHKALDVHSGPRDQQLQRFEKVYVVYPALDAELLLRRLLVQTPGRFPDHRLLGWRERTRFVRIAIDRRRVPVGPDQRCQGLDQVPRWAIYSRLVTRV